MNPKDLIQMELDDTDPISNPVAKMVDEQKRHRKWAIEAKKSYEGQIGDWEDDRMNYGPEFAFHCGFQAGLGASIDFIDIMFEEIEYQLEQQNDDQDDI